MRWLVLRLNFAQRKPESIEAIGRALTGLARQPAANGEPTLRGQMLRKRGGCLNGKAIIKPGRLGRRLPEDRSPSDAIKRRRPTAAR